MTVLPDPKFSKMYTEYIFCMVLVVQLGHGIFHPGAVMFFSKSVFG